MRSASIFLSFIVALSTLAGAQEQATPSPESKEAPIRNVYVNIAGDKKLAHRLSTFLDLELGDAGFSTVGSEDSADAVIAGEVRGGPRQATLSLGVIELRYFLGGENGSRNFCASISEDENRDLFEGASAELANQLRHSFPQAKSFRIDPASDVTASKVFGHGLMRSLQDAGFTPAGPRTQPDIGIHVDLKTVTVAVNETLTNYRLMAVARNKKALGAWNGNGILAVAPVRGVPRVCPARFVDFDWLTGNDALYTAARNVVKAMRKENAERAAGADGSSL